MVAWQPVIAAGSGLGARWVTKKVPQVMDNEDAQNGVQALAGLVLIGASTQVDNPSAKSAMVGAGVGIIGGTAEDYVGFMEA